MASKNFPTIRAAVVAIAAVLLLADTASAQRFRRGRRAYTVERYQLVVPSQSYYRQVEYREEEAPVEVEDRTSAAPVTFRVLMPASDAQLWVDGTRTTSTGPIRTVVAPARQADGLSRYILRGQWSQEGRVVTDTRQVDCYPGDRVTIDFIRPDPRGIGAEIVPSEVPGPKE